MQEIYQTPPQESQVMALFADRIFSFSLLKGATFSDLADRVDHLDGVHTGSPKAVILKFAVDPTSGFRAVQPERT